MKKKIFIIIISIAIIFFIVYLILKKNENFKNKKKMIIIGNGPSVLSRKLGPKIDTFDKVVRFNNFSLEPKYIGHTGKRTDFWFINGVNIRRKKKNILDKMKNIECEKIFIEQNTYDTKNRLLRLNPELEKNSKVEFCDINLFKDIQYKYFSKKSFNPHPSLGLQAINFLVNKYPQYDYYILGFDNFNSELPHHYMDDSINRDNNAHDTKKEIRFLEHLIKKYNIKRL